MRLLSHIFSTLFFVFNFGCPVFAALIAFFLRITASLRSCWSDLSAWCDKCIASVCRLCSSCDKGLCVRLCLTNGHALPRFADKLQKLDPLRPMKFYPFGRKALQVVRHVAYPKESLRTLMKRSPFIVLQRALENFIQLFLFLQPMLLLELSYRFNRFLLFADPSGFNITLNLLSLSYRDPLVPPLRLQSLPLPPLSFCLDSFSFSRLRLTLPLPPCRSASTRSLSNLICSSRDLSCSSSLALRSLACCSLTCRARSSA